MLDVKAFQEMIVSHEGNRMSLNPDTKKTEDWIFIWLHRISSLLIFLLVPMGLWPCVS